MIKGGKGGAKTLTGLKFEKRAHLEAVIEPIPEYDVKNNVVYFEGKKVAELYKKHGLYKRLLEPKKIKYKKILSKKLLPDDAILVFKKKTLYIIEIKFQKGAGSVDEKLQTCHFKLRQYKKLVKRLGLKVEYIYVLNNWFKQPGYKDTLDYIKSVKCKYFFNILPLKELGLPLPKKSDSK